MMGGYMSSGASINEECDLYAKWKPKHPVGGDVVLIPIDESTHAEKAFSWYVQHMHKPSNIVRLLYCVDLQFTKQYDIREKSFGDELDEKRRNSQYIAEKYYQRLAECGVSGSVQTFVGIPGEVILDHAIRTNTSSIIMGSRGLGILRRTILGSVSTYVVHNSKVPVTIIPQEN